jgi:hypothetical protein
MGNMANVTLRRDTPTGWNEEEVQLNLRAIQFVLSELAAWISPREHQVLRQMEERLQNDARRLHNDRIEKEKS